MQNINQLPQIIDILLDLILTMKLSDLITCLDSILMYTIILLLIIMN